MNRLSILLGISLLVVGIAGCAEGPAPAAGDDDSFDDFDLKAEEGTGLIRGVVVDSAVVPVQGATVQLDADGSLTSVTNMDGAFGFSDVAPGLHQLLVSRPGFSSTQTSVDVKADVALPPVIKVLLERDLAQTPYVQSFQFSGYIECSGSTPAYRVAICAVPDIVTDLLGQPSLMSDVFMATYQIDQKPTFVQSEMVWDSTQDLGDRMLLVAEVDAEDGKGIGDANGTSPLVVTAHEDVIKAAGMDTAGQLQIRVFNFEHPATTPPVAVCDIPNLVHGGTMCLKGVGLTLSQDFEVFSHVTYRFAPPEGWQFTVDGAPVVPTI